jgi:hypothetical protein
MKRAPSMHINSRPHTRKGAIKDQLYTFTWSIKFADCEFQQFQATQHQLYLMHGLIDNAGAQYYQEWR